MSYRLTADIQLRPTQTGLTLKARLVDSAGSNVGGEITTGFVEIGRGTYLWDYSAIPDGHRGGVKILNSADDSLVAFASIAPECGENLDAKVSTRLASSGYTAPDNSSISAIKSKTDNLPSDPADQSLVIDATTAIMNRLGAPAGASVSADIAAIPTVEEIDAQLSGTHGDGDWDALSTDPLASPVPGSYASGTAGAALGRIGVGAIKTTNSLTPGNDLYIIKGDSYIVEIGNAIEFTDAESEVALPDLTDVEAKLALQSVVVDGEVISSPGPTVIRFELTAENTLALSLDESRYALQLFFPADPPEAEPRRTVVKGRLIVSEATE